MKILDLSAGNRAIWLDKKHPLATYIDKRIEVFPDVLSDSTKLPKSLPTDYDLVVFDPPHLNTGKNSEMSKRYGHHTTKEILELVKGTAKEAHRVTRSDAVMALKWNTHDITLKRVFELMYPYWEPLFGHLTKDGPRSQTFWIQLRRLEVMR